MTKRTALVGIALYVAIALGMQSVGLAQDPQKHLLEKPADAQSAPSAENPAPSKQGVPDSSAPKSQDAASAPEESTAKKSSKPDESRQESDSTDQPALSPWKTLSTGVTDRNSSRRAEAIQALGTLHSSSRAIRTIERTLANDEDSSIRAIAAKVLGDMGARSAIPSLRKSLKDESMGVRFQAAKSLWSMGDRSGRPVLIQILAGEKSASPGVIKSQMDSAKKELEDPKKLAMDGALGAASSLFGPAGWGIKIMQEVTHDRSAPARATSAILLGPDPSLDGLRELEDALTDKSWIVRAAAAQALGATKHRGAISSLLPLLRDSKPPVRFMAAASILRLSNPGSLRASVPGKSVSESRPVFGATATLQTRKETP